MAEAKVVIEAFGMRRVESRSRLFPVFESSSGEVVLVVSGVGKINAAAATAVLATKDDAGGKACGWINFGIGGCSESRYGQPILASKVIDDAAERSWYPVPCWKKRHDLERLPVTTVDHPVSDHSRVPGVVEMEAAGFYPMALKDTTSELAHVVKVVSDDPDHSLETLRKDQVTPLCEQAWPRIASWSEAFREVVASESVRLADPPGLSDWLARLHFTVTQQHQLRKLLQDRYSIAPESSPPVWEAKNPREALVGVRQELEELRRPGKQV